MHGTGLKNDRINPDIFNRRLTKDEWSEIQNSRKRWPHNNHDVLFVTNCLDQIDEINEDMDSIYKEAEFSDGRLQNEPLIECDRDSVKNQLAALKEREYDLDTEYWNVIDKLANFLEDNGINTKAMTDKDIYEYVETELQKAQYDKE